MKKNLILAKDKAKKTIKDNSTKLWLAGTGVATIGAAYLLGKTHGSKSFVAEIYLTPVDKDAIPISTIDLPLVK